MSHVNTGHTLTTHFFGKAWNEHSAALILRPVTMYCDYACLTSTLILSSNLRLDLPSFLLSSDFLITVLYLISETYRLKWKTYTNQHRHHIIEDHISEWTAVPVGIAQSVQRLATGWTVLGKNPGGGEIFHAVQTRPKAHSASGTMDNIQTHQNYLFVFLSRGTLDRSVFILQGRIFSEYKCQLQAIYDILHCSKLFI
jgi:hypothetical protein